MSKRLNYSNDGTLLYKVNSSNTVRSGELGSNKNVLDSDKYETTNYNIMSYYSYVFNFPSAIVIDKFAMNCNQSKNMTVYVSSNSTDGMDGDWTQVMGSTSYGANVYREFTITTPTAGTWLRVNQNANDAYWHALHLYGEYVTPQFEIWDGDGAAGAELVANYAIMPDAGDGVDYSEFQAFTIKNVDTVTHSYSISIEAMKNSGDATMLSKFQLSDDDGSSKSSTLTVTSLASGAFSSELRLYMDLLAADNPANGYHYFNVKIEETS